MVLGSSPVTVTSPSDFAPASSKEFLDIQATIECRFTLKRVRDMTRTYSTGDLIGNKIADKITLIGKPKEKEIEEIYIPPEKDNKLLIILDCFECNFIENKMCLLLYKNGISKNCKFS